MKLKAFLLHKTVVALAVVALLASAVWTALNWQAYVDAGKTSEKHLVLTPSYTVVSHRATTVWPAGTDLGQGAAAYFYLAQPMVDLTPNVRIGPALQGQLNGTLRTELTLRSVNQSGQVYWSLSLQAADERAFTLESAADGQLRMLDYSASGLPIDAAAAYERAAQVNKELGFENGIVQLVVRTTVDLTGTLEGQTFEKSIVTDLPLALTPVSFSLPVTSDQTASILLPSASGIAGRSALDLLVGFVTADRLRAIPLSAAAVLVLLLAVQLLLFSRSRKGWSRESTDAARFKEWITEGSFQARSGVLIHIRSLQGLVDLAIDLDKRVIHDARKRQYYVLDENTVYIHDPAKPEPLAGGASQLGKLLIDGGLISPGQLETALYYQQRVGLQLGESLMALGFVDESSLYSTLAVQKNLPYLEIQPEDFAVDSDYLAKVPLAQAKALASLPIGRRSDGRLVVASGKPATEGLKASLEEILHTEIAMVMVRPSIVAKAFEALSDPSRLQDADESAAIGPDRVVSVASRPAEGPVDAMTRAEWKKFVQGFTRGVLTVEPLLQELGLAGPETVGEVPDEAPLLGWLVHRGILSGDLSNLLRGLGRAVAAMDWKARQQRTLPGLLAILHHADYLTKGDLEWVGAEAERLGAPVEQVLDENHLASRTSIRNALWMRASLERLLTRSPNEPV